MYYASQKRKENIAEYLLYMWQIEDLIPRQQSRYRQNTLFHLSTSATSPRKKKRWKNGMKVAYRHDASARVSEENGHLQLSKNVIIQLSTTCIVS